MNTRKQCQFFEEYTSLAGHAPNEPATVARVDKRPNLLSAKAPYQWVLTVSHQATHAN